MSIQEPIPITTGAQVLFRGSMLFKLKASKGLPLGFALGHVIDSGLFVEWPSFIEEARANNWSDPQTFSEICHAMEDAGMSADDQSEVKARFKLYVLQNPRTEIKQ